MNTKIALLQMSMSADKEKNLSTAIDCLTQAANNGAQIACLPELFLTPYFCQRELHSNFALAEEIDGATTKKLSQVAKDLSLVIIASLFEKRALGLYHNTAIVIDNDGKLCGIYRKTHIPDDPNFYEKFYFAPGDTGFKTFTTNIGKIGVIICWDQWFAESARLTALSGAEIIFAPTAIGWHPTEKNEFGKRQHNAWETVQRGHAIANGVYFAVCNRTGFELAEPQNNNHDGIEFWGQSFIADPMGEIIALAPSNQPAIIYANVNSQLIENTRTAWPFFRDRRGEMYQELTKLYGE